MLQLMFAMMMTMIRTPVMEKRKFYATHTIPHIHTSTHPRFFLEMASKKRDSR